MRKPGSPGSRRRASSFRQGFGAGWERPPPRFADDAPAGERHRRFLRALHEALDAAARGDFSVRLEGGGLDPLEEGIRRSFNRLLEQNDLLVDELLRMDGEVRREGIAGLPLSLPHAGDDWGRIATSVNGLVGTCRHLILRGGYILDRLAAGELDVDLSMDLDGIPATGLLVRFERRVEILVDRLRYMATNLLDLTTQIREEGRLGLRADPDRLGGSWRELVESMNLLSLQLNDQLQDITQVSRGIAGGNLAHKVSVEAAGEILELKNTINATVDQLRTFAGEVTRVAREVGTEGRLGGQAHVPNVAGTWRELTESVNSLVSNLTAQVRSISMVTTAVAKGDLSQKIAVPAQGEVEELKETMNAMVDRLRTFAAEVTRVAREVGTEGRLGGQAEVPDVSGTWKALTESVNVMASNLTDQVRGISRVVTAVANGDLSQRLTLGARGEIGTLADTINAMTDTLRTFSDQVTTVAREVGTEGRLGGQAIVPNAAGIWRDLIDNVNRLAANLTTQVRAISEVAEAVIEGDLSRSITVDALGELLALKDTINQMISNLRASTRENEEQDWLKTNLAEFFNLMQGQASLETLTQEIINKLTPVVHGQHGAFYLFDDEEQVLELKATYAHVKRHRLASRFTLGEGLVGQCAVEGSTIVVSELPEDYSVIISSGLGEAPAREVLVSPIFYEGRLKGVVEISSFTPFTRTQISLVEQLMLSVGVTINLIRTSLRTSQVLEELKGSNLELEAGRRELEEKAELLEQRNQEIAKASRSLESKAKELSRVSRYKSEFLANMSHEIRTPLNSMLILAQMLAADEEGRLSERQREWAAMIHSAGKDLLALINQVLDLSRVEAGRLEVDVRPFSLDVVEGVVERTFRPLALQKGLEFSVERSREVGSEMVSDRQLLVQILLNLVSNAFKFTSEGEVRVRIEPATRRQLDAIGAGPEAEGVAFSVQDTGIGIPASAQERIFEAFSQADGSITRSYEGTGLGLAISMEYARILQGTLEVESEEGVGSTFTLIVPARIQLRGEERRPRLGLGPRSEPTSPGEAAPRRGEDPRGVERGEGPPAAEPPEERAGGGEARAARGGPDGEGVVEPPPPAPGRTLEGKTALIVEDDVRNLYATTALLESLGMSVLTATDARSGFRFLEQNPGIDVILMDVMMPEIDGYQAIARIRRMPRGSEIPILVFSAKASKSDREQAEAVGADGFVIKPAEIGALSRAITKLVGGQDGS